mmetsp:Transcript_20289/g.51910  ORF Transcript_20289/g.51910 Transcript_20289/m.51910 type:complete len:627 (-) Transcript_20289:4386-6266(-)
MAPVDRKLVYNRIAQLQREEKGQARYRHLYAIIDDCYKFICVLKECDPFGSADNRALTLAGEVQYSNGKLSVARDVAVFGAKHRGKFASISFGREIKLPEREKYVSLPDIHRSSKQRYERAKKENAEIRKRNDRRVTKIIETQLLPRPAPLKEAYEKYIVNGALVAVRNQKKNYDSWRREKELVDLFKMVEDLAEFKYSTWTGAYVAYLNSIYGLLNQAAPYHIHLNFGAGFLSAAIGAMMRDAVLSACLWRGEKYERLRFILGSIRQFKLWFYVPEMVLPTLEEETARDPDFARKASPGVRSEITEFRKMDERRIKAAERVWFDKIQKYVDKRWDEGIRALKQDKVERKRAREERRREREEEDDEEEEFARQVAEQRKSKKQRAEAKAQARESREVSQSIMSDILTSAVNTIKAREEVARLQAEADRKREAGKKIAGFLQRKQKAIERQKRAAQQLAEAVAPAAIMEAAYDEPHVDDFVNEVMDFTPPVSPRNVDNEALHTPDVQPPSAESPVAMGVAVPHSPRAAAAVHDDDRPLGRGRVRRRPSPPSPSGSDGVVINQLEDGSYEWCKGKSYEQHKRKSGRRQSKSRTHRQATGYCYDKSHPRTTIKKKGGRCPGGMRRLYKE